MFPPGVFEVGDTVQFAWEAVLPPDASPRFSITDAAGTILQSVTAIASGPMEFYSAFTMPDSCGWYLYEWQAFKTIAGSAYQFINRGIFKIEETRIGPEL